VEAVTRILAELSGRPLERSRGELEMAVYGMLAPALVRAATSGDKAGRFGLGHRPSRAVKVLGQVDRGHPAASELALERVAVGQGGRELLQGLGQRPVGLGSL
jgi:hypothetical protein